MNGIAAIKTLGVVGAGIMGRGIAQAAAATGIPITLVDSKASVLEHAMVQLRGANAKLESTGIITTSEREMRDLAVTTSTSSGSLSACDLIVEAVPEMLELKLSVLTEIAGTVRPDAILASNTSSIPITLLSTSVSNPGRFIGVHFFNPVPRMPLVEIIRPLLSEAETVIAVEAFVRDRLGKEPITVGDRPGFVVNALLIPFLLSATRMLDIGYTAAETIDVGMRLGAGHPMGPLALCDLIGLDTVCQVADALYAETRDAQFVVPGVLRRQVEAGRLGRKSGSGFFEYDRA